MISKSLDNLSIMGSVKVYQMLLVAYPTKFRQEYGPHMVQMFRDCCLRAFRQSGTNGMLKLWAITLCDLLRSSIEEHLQKETFMTRSKFIRLSGWSLMLGAVTLFLFILGAYLGDNVYDPFRRLVPLTEFGTQLGVWATPVLLGVGLLGLRTRYGDEVDSFGKSILLFGAIAGPVINIIGITIPPIGDWGWLLPFTGNAVLLASLSIFGIPALSARPLPRWNSLPIIAGVWYPVLLILVVIFGVIGLTQNWIDNLANPAYIAIPLQCVLLVVLGHMLQADLPEEILATA
jgi:hypothetical protein